MRIVKINLKDIEFQYQSYTQELYDSVMRIGFSFPIHVCQTEHGFLCVDGHKRLSILQDILKNNPHYSRGEDVCVLIQNGEHARSNDCWRGRNSH